MKLKLASLGECTLEQDGCASCGDIVIPAQVIHIEGHDALVQDRLEQEAWVAVDFVPNVKTGDIVLVHMGIALARSAE